jgi:uncharacterized repeat protein (TIGR03806 family)
MRIPLFARNFATQKRPETNVQPLTQAGFGATLGLGFTRLRRVTLLALLAASTIFGRSQTAFVDFNTPGQLTANFNLWNDAGGTDGGNYAFQEGTNAGVAGSGGISVFQSSDTTASYNAGSWDFSTNGAAIVVSTLIKANGLRGTDKVQLGILNVTPNGLNNNAGVAFESFRFIPSGALWSLREQYRANGSLIENTLGNLSYVVGHWYKFQVNLTNVSGATGNYNADCAIYDYGTDGLTPGTNIVTFSTLRSNTGQDIATTSTVYPALRAFQDGGIDAWDNFLVYTPASKPIFTLPLTNVIASAGQAITFSVLAGGPGTITYSWRTNGTLVGGVNSSSYTSPPLSTNYTSISVSAANANGATTSSATITVGTIGVTNMAPIPVTGFNRDVVIESNSSGPPYTTALEFNPGEGTAFYQAGLPGTSYGLPANRTLTSAVGDGTVFQFQPYTGSNALVLSSETAVSSGALTLVTPVVYSRIAILANSASGGGTPSLTLHFADGSTYTTNYNAPDWFFNTGFALQGVDRINLSSGATDGGPNDPRFYQTTIDLAAALGAANTQPLSSISFDQAAAGATAIYAVSGLRAGSVSLPTVATVPASAIQATSALLGGQVLSTGGESPSITLFYGTADGGTNAANWSKSVPLGRQGAAFSQTVTGLASSTGYYFTVSGQNAAGTVWATPSRNFTTATLQPAVVTNLPATDVQANTATLNGEVVSTGGDTPTVTLFYGPQDGGTTPAAWSNNVPLGLQSSAYSQGVSGLSSNQVYFFTAQASNSIGVSWAIPSQNFKTALSNTAPVLVPMLTYHNDNTRQGVNTNETILTLANVGSGSFGKMFSHSVDGYVYAQPLVMTNVSIPGKGVHNVVYIVTEHDSVYAFDADDNSGANASPLWQVSFLNPANGVTSVPGGDVGTSDIVPEIGMTATPVIDPATGTMYLEAKTKEVVGGVANYVHRLHALDITTGAERTTGVVANSPVVINATAYPGTGSSGYNDNDGAGHVLFNTLREHSRPALTLLNGILYLGFASHGDNQPYHGWLFSYDAHTLAQISVYNTTPNGGLGGFWQGGGGATVDSAGNIYFETGNGTFDATGSSFSQTNNNFAMSVLKFSTTNGNLKLVDYFTMHDAVSLSGGDVDLGSGASIVLPDSIGTATHPHLLAAAGKDGRIYLIDRDNMGHFNAANDSQIVQVVPNAFAGGQNGSYMTPVFFNNTLYYIGMNDRLKAFSMSPGQISLSPTVSSTVFGDKGSSSPSLSANGTSNAILWAIESDAYASSGPGILHAYNATNVAQELYNSSLNLSRDNPGGAVKFTTPTIVNGKVYVGAQFSLSVYGVANFIATPIISPNGGIFTNSITVTLSDPTAGTTIYYTLDGTTPTTNSIRYTVPFTLTNSAGVQAVATKPGAVNSAIASAGFINSSVIGNGVGLLGQYWSNQLPTSPFAGAPTLVRTDPVVNFNWGNGSPDPSISVDHFTARWTGAVQPQFDETYTFTTTTDDGVRLWVNGQLIINEWVDQGPTPWSGSIALKAQQRYNIEMDYYENGGGAEAILSWSSPSTPLAIIPQSQLYPVTNPPPGVSLTGPANGSSFTASASVTLSATAAAQFNRLQEVDFYANNALIGAISNAPYTLTTTGLGQGNYSLVAVAVDATGLAGTSAPVNITVSAATGQPYGLTTRLPVTPFLGMPSTFNASLPKFLSQTGAFTNAPAMTPTSGLLPYDVNVPLWSDGAVKTRWMAVPNSGAPFTPDEQVSFAPTGEWSFPVGTVFVKHFDLITDLSDPNAQKRRLETRLLVRDPNGSVYGVTYKWRPDNSDADLLTNSLNEDIIITNLDHSTWTQTWYYPSPADCLTCHTPAANYVLGVKTRQLNKSFTYPSTGTTDNELRALNHIGLFNPAFDEAALSGYSQLSALTNTSASLEERARSYLDANCAQCHRPGGSGATFDARYDTPLTNQNIINALPQKGDLGLDNARVVVPKDIWRSVLYARMNTSDPAIKMPGLARNLIDTNAVQVMSDWINSLPGTPALEPPTISPAGGSFNGPVAVALLSSDTNAAIYFTLDGTVPSSASSLYSGPFMLSSNAIVRANAAEVGFSTSVSVLAQFNILPGIVFSSFGFSTNGTFQLELSGPPGKTYILQGSTDFANWIPISTNVPTSSPFTVVDPAAANFRYRFYRAVQLP